MYATLLLAFLLAGTTLAAQVAPDDTAGPTSLPALESFSVASYEGQSWLIVDVQPVRPNGSKVRFIQVHCACGSVRVHEIDHVFEDASVQQLAKGVDLCSSDQAVAGTINSFKRKQDESGQYPALGVEAQCGVEKVRYLLPNSGALRFTILQAKNPRIAALWRLSKDIQQLYSQESGQVLRSHGQGDGEKSGLGAQELAEQAAIELHNGVFDLVVPVPDMGWTEGKSRISELVPEFQEATGLEENLAVVGNLDHLGVEKYAKVLYPQMALIAHIHGETDIELSVDPDSGVVKAVTAKSGHPILLQSAIDSAKQWIFIHPYLGPNPLRVEIRFEKMHCSPVMSTSSMAAPKRRKQANGRPKR